MPSFRYRDVEYHNPVEFVLDLVGGKWKLPIIWRLRDGTRRYGELRSDLPAITAKMLTQQLRELERDGFITRTVHPVVPPHVDYDLTPRGRATIPHIEALRAWGHDLMREFGITT